MNEKGSDIVGVNDKDNDRGCEMGRGDNGGWYDREGLGDCGLEEMDDEAEGHSTEPKLSTPSNMAGLGGLELISVLKSFERGRRRPFWRAWRMTLTKPRASGQILTEELLGLFVRLKF